MVTAAAPSGDVSQPAQQQEPPGTGGKPAACTALRGPGTVQG